MPPLRLILAALLVVALAVVWRRQLWQAVRGSVAAFNREIRATNPLHYGALGVVLGVTVWLRWHYWDVPMRWDESYSFLTFAVPKLSDGLGHYHPNNHPLNTLMMHFSTTLFGAGHRAVRAPVFAAGIVVPLAAYVATLRLYGRQVALVAAAFFAGSAQLVEYSTNARGYELTALATVLMIAMVPSLLRSNHPLYWAIFALISSLGLFAQSVFLYALLPTALAIAAGGLLGYAHYSKKRFLISLAAATVGAVAFAALLYGPLLSGAIHFAWTGGGLSAYHPADVGGEIWRVWTLGIAVPIKIVLAIGFGLGAAFAFQRWIGRFPIAATLVLVAIAVTVAGRVAIYTRYFVPVLPLALLASVVGLIGFGYARTYMARPRVDLLVTGVAAAIALGLAVSVSRGTTADQEGSALPAAPQIADFVKPRLGPNDKLLVSNCAWPIEAYTFYSRGWPYATTVVGTIDAAQASKGNTYVVVNHDCQETLSSVVTRSAAGSGLAPNGRRVASFPGADVYELPSAS